MRLEPLFATEPLGTDVFSVRFSPDDAFLAAAGTSGVVSVINVSTGREAFQLNQSVSKRPVKQICWRPEGTDTPARNRGVLVAASTDGHVRQWHVASGRCLQTLGDGESGQLFCVDYSPDSCSLVAGGEAKLWVFDEATGRCTTNLSGGDTLNTVGHSSRVFAARFLTPSPAVVVSAGWDRTVQFWDLRVGHAVRAIFGTDVCGDALDITSDGRQILTGSWRSNDQLEFWDVGSCERVHSTSWRPTGLSEPACFVFTARLSPGESNSLIASGGTCGPSNSGEAKVFRREHDVTNCLGTLTHLACFSADFSRSSSLVAFGGGDGRVRTLRIV